MKLLNIKRRPQQCTPLRTAMAKFRKWQNEEREKWELAKFHKLNAFGFEVQEQAKRLVEKDLAVNRKELEYQIKTKRDAMEVLLQKELAKMEVTYEQKVKDYKRRCDEATRCIKKNVELATQEERAKMHQEHSALLTKHYEISSEKIQKLMDLVVMSKRVIMGSATEDYARETLEKIAEMGL